MFSSSSKKSCYSPFVFETPFAASADDGNDDVDNDEHNVLKKEEKRPSYPKYV